VVGSEPDEVNAMGGLFRMFVDPAPHCATMKMLLDAYVERMQYRSPVQFFQFVGSLRSLERII
jgi:hypothetical protein